MTTLWDQSGTSGCQVCGRDNDHGTPSALEFGGHLNPAYQPTVLPQSEPDTHPTEATVDSYKTITVCGSMRFYDTMLTVAEWLTMEKYVVLMPFVRKGPLGDDDESRQMLDRMHLRKIDLSDGIYVVDVDGYIGDSTRREIAYARSKNLPIRFYYRDAVLGLSQSSPFLPEGP